MTRYALIADVHGNLPALEAVLAALPPHDVLVCAGDLVGYGPFPNETVARLREVNAVCVAGNHDLVATGRLPDTLDGDARPTMDFTRRVLEEDARAFLASLQLTRSVDDVFVLHGSLDDPERYVSTPTLARAQLALLPGPRALVAGHTHRPLEVREEERLWVNPGSVGQSRERRAGARFALLDGERLELRRVDYDVERTRAELRRHGLPESAVHLRPSLLRAAARSLRR